MVLCQILICQASGKFSVALPLLVEMDRCTRHPISSSASKLFSSLAQVHQHLSDNTFFFQKRKRYFEEYLKKHFQLVYTAPDLIIYQQDFSSFFPYYDLSASAFVFVSLCTFPKRLGNVCLNFLELFVGHLNKLSIWKKFNWYARQPILLSDSTIVCLLFVLVRVESLQAKVLRNM